MGANVQPSAGRDAADDKPKSLLDEPHVCRGLNACKGKGGCGGTAKKNECAGQGGCATAEKHEYARPGQNACKGQSGCGPTPGENACKGKGGCGPHYSADAAWKKVRARFEEAMKKADKKFGPAPPKK